MSPKEGLSFALFCGACLVLSMSLAWCMTGCIGYGEFISPAEAQRIEREQCMRKSDAEQRRICLAQVARKYQRYNSEGGYPEQWTPPNPRQ